MKNTVNKTISLPPDVHDAAVERAKKIYKLDNMFSRYLVGLVQADLAQSEPNPRVEQERREELEEAKRRKASSRSARK